jgi:predicted DCC family thiol-disulfide oxidoreductase YuxK
MSFTAQSRCEVAADETSCARDCDFHDRAPSQSGNIETLLSELKTRPAFAASASEEARKRFPFLDHDLTKQDLTVISHDGAVYFGPKAWLMVLWALARYREWSYRLASPELLPTTKRVVSAISQNRYQISRVAGLTR